jgi:hypothetical protein
MSLHDFIFTNFRRKLFSLMLAILIWLTIHFAEKQRQGGAGSQHKHQTNSMILP